MGWAIMAAGTLILLALVWFLGGKSPSLRYVRRPWSWRETLLAAAAVIPALVILIPWPFIDRSSLQYSPYLKISMPSFNIIIGLSLAALALPGFFTRDRHR
jgi:hypothetical protein